MARENYRPWTDEEIAKVRRLYSKVGAIGLAAEMPYRSEQSITSKAHQMGLTCGRGVKRPNAVTGTPWTHEEMVLLKKQFPRIGPVECAKLFKGRSLQSIKGKANAMGIAYKAKHRVEVKPIAKPAPEPIQNEVLDEDANPFVHRWIAADKAKPVNVSAPRSVFDMAAQMEVAA